MAPPRTHGRQPKPQAPAQDTCLRTPTAETCRACETHGKASSQPQDRSAAPARTRSHAISTPKSAPAASRQPAAQNQTPGARRLDTTEQLVHSLRGTQSPASPPGSQNRRPRTFQRLEDQLERERRQRLESGAAMPNQPDHNQRTNTPQRSRRSKNQASTRARPDPVRAQTRLQPRPAPDRTPVLQLDLRHPQLLPPVGQVHHLLAQSAPRPHGRKGSTRRRRQPQ